MVSLLEITAESIYYQADSLKRVERNPDRQWQLNQPGTNTASVLWGRQDHPRQQSTVFESGQYAQISTNAYHSPKPTRADTGR